MVDEFQDTNELRWEIVKMIASDKEGNLRPKGLFIVGDHKQSIYRFNQADVEVMNTAQSALLPKEVQNSPDSAEREDALINFNDNYRASKNFISHVINFIFPQLMPDANTSEIRSYEAAFEATNYPRNNASVPEIAERTPVCCDLRATINEAQEVEEYLPALNTALMLKDLLKWAEENNLTKTGKPVVGVLLRNFNNIQHYLRVLQQYEIPFEIVSGKNLFQQQETYDLFHLISVLINPFDDPALVGRGNFDRPPRAGRRHRCRTDVVRRRRCP